MSENRWYLTPILNTWATPNENITLRGWANGQSGDPTYLIYPLRVATDPTNADWRANSAPASYEFIPNVGIRTFNNDPITDATGMFAYVDFSVIPEISGTTVSTSVDISDTDASGA